MTDEKATVFIIDDDPSVRKGLSRLVRAVGMQVETYASAQEFLERPHYTGWGCILLDFLMPGMTGLELQAQLVKSDYSLPIIFVSAHAEVPDAAAAMRKGAVDFLTKPVDRDHLLKSIAESLERDSEKRRALVDQARAQKRFASLSPREYEVMTYVIAGLLNKQIAYALGITEDTVKKHRGRVMKKLCAGSVAELIHLAELGNVKPAHSNDF